MSARSAGPRPLDPIPNRPPVVTVAAQDLQAGEVVSGSALVSAVDPEGRAVTSFTLWDGDASEGSGYWSLDGVALAAQTRLVLSAADFGRVEFHAGADAATEVFGAAAFDGHDWSGLERFTVTTALSNQAPTVALDSFTLARGSAVDATSFVHAVDGDGAGDIVRYVLRDLNDGVGSGHWVVNGQAQAAMTDIVVEASDLAGVRWQAGASLSGAVDAVSVVVFDKAGPSNVAHANITTAANEIPDVAVRDGDVAADGMLSVPGLVSVSDANGDAMTLWAVWDNTEEGGHFVYGDGVAVAAKTYTQLTAAEFATLKFVGAGADAVDHLELRAFDGLEWSSPWDAFAVTSHASTTDPLTF